MDKKIETNGESVRRHTSVSRGLAAGWLVLAALLVVFANDLNQWAVAAESTSAQSKVLPVTQVLLGLANGTGIARTRQAVEAAVHQLYDDPLVVAQRRTTALSTSALPVTPVVGIAATTSSEAPQQVQAQAADPKFTPTRVLLVGDSSIQAGLGTKLERRLETYENTEVNRFGLHSTGLARPDYFDWNDKLTELMGDFSPDLVIAYWGDNDCQGLSTKQGDFVAHFGTDEWDTEYGYRVEQIVGLIRGNGSEVVIIGMPIMRSKSFSKRIARLNGVVEQATEEAGGHYLPTWDICADEDGNYMASVEFEGKDRIIRAGDGIHLSNHGAEYVAFKICEVLEGWFNMVAKEEE